MHDPYSKWSDKESISHCTKLRLRACGVIMAEADLYMKPVELNSKTDDCVLLVSKLEDLSCKERSLQTMPIARTEMDHVCSPIGCGVHMYNFSMLIGDKVLQFWEGSGKQLFWLSEQHFWRLYGEAGVLVNQVQELMKTTWTIRYVKTWNSRGKLIVIALSLLSTNLAQSLRALAIYKPEPTLS